MMKKIVIILLVVIPAIKPVYADTWALPKEADYFSENNKFVAHVTPATKETKSKLELFEIKASEKLPLWKCTLGNEGAPQMVFVSDSGRNVVTFNEVSGRVHGGMGDYVIAFYNREGLIKNYSLEQILHYPDKIDEKEFRRLIGRSVSGRYWAGKPVFFDSFDNKLFFCAWLTYGQRWLAWDVSNGKEIKIEDLMVQRWNKKGRRWALNEIREKTKFHLLAYEFLGNLKNPEDRSLIEKLLSDENFSQYNSLSNVKSPQADKWVYRLVRCISSSYRRLLAEQILANWDGRPTTNYQPSYRQPLYYLGKVEGTVSLPKTDNPKEATLWIYLVPSSIQKDQWHKKPLVQYLVANFADYSFRNFDLEFKEKLPFTIAAVTPGQYRIKAVLDRTKPLSKSSDPIYVPRQGDYQSLDSTVITVEAGKTVDNITIDCTHKVTNAIN
jgi:hypothetical protein